jgi:IS605 OrfB family transposase
VWVKAALLHTDMEYLRKNWTGVKASAPTLEKKHGKYYLRFSYREERALPAKGAHEQRICAVDLGLNSDAVCSIMEADGTVSARKFIDFADEKDRLWKVLGRIRRKSREHGPESVRGLWKYAVRCNEELAKKTAAAIARFAEENGADVIVFEYLDMKGRIRGKRKMRLHMWKKRGVQKICAHMAHRKGIRVSRVCAWNTSALAYDGSGDVMRDPDNHSLCTFTSGKRYNCDLSASYNIGARYYIRELTKPMPATAWSVLEAEVPAVRRRSSCVYADLVRLHAVMRENGWTA